MNSERLKMLEQFAVDEPNDPFNIYALALEYVAIDSSKAGLLFTQLLEHHKEYLPTYYAAANFFAQLNQPEEAAKILEAGIELAMRQNNQKTLRELRSALDNLD